VREIRSLGSVRGAGRKPGPYRDVRRETGGGKQVQVLPRERRARHPGSRALRWSG